MTLRITRRAGIVAATSLAALLAFAAPALAHTEITLDPARAGASSVAMKVNAEAENDSAGIKSVQIFMPQGVDPAKVTLLAAPDGWTVQSGADNVTVSGPALTPKTNASFSLMLAELPASETVVTFKTLVTYTDGKVDRWIGAPGSDNPAPTVSLAPANAPATTGPAIRSDDAAPTTAAAAPAPASSNGSTWWIVALVVLALIALGLWLMARRRRAG